MGGLDPEVCAEEGAAFGEDCGEGGVSTDHAKGVGGAGEGDPGVVEGEGLEVVSAGVELDLGVKLGEFVVKGLGEREFVVGFAEFFEGQADDF